MIRCTDCSFISHVQPSICKQDDCIGVFCGECVKLSRSHVLCGECKENLTCHESRKCIRCPIVTWITPDVAIGSREALDDSSETVVDLDYPNNGCKEGEIQEKGNVIYLGASNLFTLEELIDKVIPTLSGKILFRCKYGNKESAAFACIYLSNRMDIKEAYNMIVQKRPRATRSSHYKVIFLRNTNLEGRKLRHYHTERFMWACVLQDLDQIRKLAPTVYLNCMRFKGWWSKSPMFAVLDDKGSTEAADLLFSLGATVTPYDAYHIYNLIGVDIDISYFDYFEKKGYDIRKLQEEFKGPFLEEDEETDSSDEEELW